MITTNERVDAYERLRQERLDAAFATPEGAQAAADHAKHQSAAASGAIVWHPRRGWIPAR